ncbi:hypothetical protein E8E12_000619 [Didymella heteroderae]|uniref:Uncharacterized protein n=1 Tax=Didymella heteroderae TaxID=1769908 RepID=A0A9P5BYL2_9PLEO|nr:hypothetical protein E8E12_000619 [Didymella heteroderae]
MGNYALPNELDDNVIKHLDGHSQALVSLGRTYREFRKLTTGLLHHKIAVGKIPKSNDTMYLPMLQNIIFQLNWSEMKPHASRRIVAAFFGSIMINTKCVFNNSPPILQQIQELHILVNDDTAVFKKDFLHRLKPITNLLQAACLHKLTLLWQALATVGYKMGAQFFQQFELRARLPSSLEALHTTYPQNPT